MIKILSCTIFLLLLLNCSTIHKYETEFLSRQVTIGSEKYNFRVYVPPGRRPDQKLPVMLFLHGSGELGKDNEKQLGLLAPLIEKDSANFPFIIVFPQCGSSTFWNSKMIGQAIAALDQTVMEFDGDKNRLYLAGFSLGGYGAWQIAAQYPDKFAALVPVSGRPLPREYEKKSISAELIMLAESDDPYKAMAEKIGKMPTWIFHGGNDGVVPVEGSRRMNKALIDVGNTDVHYTEYEGMGHYSVESALTESALFEWLAKQRLKN
ncbi:MAG TPA: prolyl oligopeptidase family serine peptidase [Nitrosospira sp.]|jgi:predicted peptidase|nr:prolyl oligopeptidase family serine peptidase [Nitrosospira sp.]